MTIFRSLLFNAFFFGLIILILLFIWLLLPLPRRFMQGVVRLWSRSLRLGMRAILGLDFEVRGRDRIPEGAVLLASKHQSAWDTSVFLLLFPDTVYVIKKELLSIPLWGWYATKCRSIAVDRKGGPGALKGMIRDVRAALGEGRAVVIFPEGTRTVPGERRPYHPGIAALYTQTQATVVPVALNSGLFWGRRSFKKHPGVITVEFLPPLPEGLDRREFMVRLEESIEEASERLRAEAVERFGLPVEKDVEKNPLPSVNNGKKTAKP